MKEREALVQLTLLKRYFDASRKIKEHTLEEACDELGYHSQSLHKFFTGNLNSEPLESAVLDYIKSAGIRPQLMSAGYSLEAKPYRLAKRI